MQGHCSRKVTDENFKISSPILQTLTPKFHSNSVSALCKERYQWIASKMHGLVTLQNRRCKNRPSHFARISVSLTDSESPKFIKCFRRLEDCQFFCRFVVAPTPSLPCGGLAFQVIWFSNVDLWSNLVQRFGI